MITGKEILLALSYKYNGDWDKIYDAIKRKEKIDDDFLENALKSINSNYVTIVDDEYPTVLKDIYKPPFVLYYHGNINLIYNTEQVLAVVGSRKCTQYSEINCRKIVKELGGRLNIISGMALGIDAISHRAAIDSGASTIAVLGCGINYVYPKTNALLYEEIKRGHLIISEYPDMQPPQPDYFPFRNRIIIGLSNGVFIPEVRNQSGTMVSCAHALSQNRDVYILPQPAGSDTYNNRLIKEGACLVESGTDILNDKNLIS